MQQKVNWISCLTYRALRLCSKEHLEDKILNVKNIFLNLRYPDDIIYSIIQKTITKFENKTVQFGPKQYPVYLKLPYTANLSIENNLKKIVNTCYHSVNLRIVYKTKTLFEINNKNKLPILITATQYISSYGVVRRYTWVKQVTIQ